MRIIGVGVSERTADSSPPRSAVVDVRTHPPASVATLCAGARRGPPSTVATREGVVPSLSHSGAVFFGLAAGSKAAGTIPLQVGSRCEMGWLGNGPLAMAHRNASAKLLT